MAASVLEWLAEASPHEALSLAMLMERGARSRYLAMAAESTSPSMRAKLRYLAAEEREHFELLSDLRRGLHRRRKPRTFPTGKLTEARTGARGASPADIMRMAIDDEKESEAFYERCAQRCRRSAMKKLFARLAEMESAHKRTLEDELAEMTGAVSWRGLEGSAPTEQDFWA